MPEGCSLPIKTPGSEKPTFGYEGTCEASKISIFGKLEATKDRAFGWPSVMIDHSEAQPHGSRPAKLLEDHLRMTEGGD